MHTHTQLRGQREREGKRDRAKPKKDEKEPGSNRGDTMSQKLDNTGGSWAPFISPKTIRAESEPDNKQGPNGAGPTTFWLSSATCRDDQQGSTELNYVDIDHTEGSREPG